MAEGTPPVQRRTCWSSPQQM